MAATSETAMQSAIVYCSACIYLKECRACCKCMHPKGLKEPQPTIGTFCYYGELTDEYKTDK